MTIFLRASAALYSWFGIDGQVQLLKVVNRASVFVVYLAIVIFFSGWLLVVTPGSDYVLHVIFLSIVVAVLSIPLTLVSLVLACKVGVVSVSYVVFSVFLSVFIVLGWLVIPFSLRKDMRQFLYCLEEARAEVDGAA